MEKQIVLREPIEWDVTWRYDNQTGYSGYLRGRRRLIVKCFNDKPNLFHVNIFGEHIDTVEGTLDEAKARAEELLLEFLNSIAQPVKEKD